MDSSASHHITNDLDQLYCTTSYHGWDQLTVGDGAAMPISYTGNSKLSTTSHTLHLLNILVMPTISYNLLFVSHLCKTNPIFVEFFSIHFLVKDLKIGVPLLKGLHKDDLYYLPASPSLYALLTTILTPWHHIFGNPSLGIISYLRSKHQIKSSIDSTCISCNSSKSHKLPFQHKKCQVHFL